MSQVPPPPYQPPPPGQPQGGYPSYPQQGGPVGYAAPGAAGPSGSNPWGVVSLISGFLGCTFIGSLAAIVFGFLGIKRAKTARNGMGLSVVGLILGVLGLIGWLVFGGTILAAVGLTSGPRNAVSQFIKDVSAGNTAAAMTQTDGSASITKEDLDSLAQTMSGWGTCTNVTTFSTQINNNTATVAGIAEFTNAGKKGYSGTLVKQGGTWKMSGLHFE